MRGVAGRGHEAARRRRCAHLRRTGLRALLRFLYLDGQITTPLAGAVPSAACWQLAALPRAVSPADLARIVDDCDRRCVAGRRDYAVIVLLARLGLRAGEVAALDWATSTGGRARSPSAARAAAATACRCPPTPAKRVAGWLAGGRPPDTACPAVFVRLRPPHGRLASTSVSYVVRRASLRAGIAAAGAHRLRHSTAVTMLAAGGTLAEIGQVLRHATAQHDRYLRQGRPARAVAAGPALAGVPAMSQLAATSRTTWRCAGRWASSWRKEGRLLPDFAAFAEAAGAATVTIDLAVRWAAKPEGTSPVWAAQRLSMVRGFARYLQAIDPATQVPPAGLLPARTRRVTPYIYSDAEIAALMTAARALPSPLKAATFGTLIGLLAVTGMRGSEAMALDRGDLDAAAGLLTIRATKFRKSRQLPLHPSTLRALAAYQAIRDRLCPAPATASLLVSTTGARLCHATVQPVFRHLLGQAGIGQARTGPARPSTACATRFAVTTLLGWYRDGQDVQARLPALSTYLGHADPAATYWYLTATPELLALAAGRLEAAPGDAR